MPLADNFGAGQAFVDILMFFLFVIWIWLLIVVFGDLFRSHDLSGWAKAAWVIGIIILPYLGVLIYLIARGRSMTDRQVQAMQEQQKAQEQYIQQVAGTASPAEQISHAKSLLDSGAITQDEFNSLKAKALA